MKTRITLILSAVALTLFHPAYGQDLFVGGYDPSQGYAGYVDEYTQSGTFVRHFVPLGSGGLSQTYNLRFGPDGNLYVTSVMGTPTTGENAVKKYDGKTGAFLGNAAPIGSEDIRFDAAGNMYLDTPSAIVKVDPKTETILRTYPLKFGPAGFTFQPNGDLLVLDGSGVEVTQLDPNTGLTSPFATLNHVPRGITTGPDGRFYVTEPLGLDGGPGPDNTIEVIGPNGGPATRWSMGGLVGYYSVISDGSLYASGNGYPGDIPGVNVFDFATGQYERSFATSVDPIGIALGPTAVPEPGLMMMLGGMATGALLLRRC